MLVKTPLLAALVIFCSVISTRTNATPTASPEPSPPTAQPSASPSSSPIPPTTKPSNLPSASPSTSPSLAPSHTETPSSTPTSPTAQPTPGDPAECKIISYRKITWDDFEADVDEESDLDAETDAGVSYSFDSTTRERELNKNGKPTGRIISRPTNLKGFSYMNTCNSWATDEAKADTDPALLKHEQLHFDIAECWARALDMALKAAIAADELKGFGPTGEKADEDLKRKIEKIVKKFAKEEQAMDGDYDSKKETDHGRNESKQKEWESYIDGLLKSGKCAQKPKQKPKPKQKRQRTHKEKPHRGDEAPLRRSS